MTEPRFAALDHPGLPEWARVGLDGLFAADERIRQVHFDLWPSGWTDGRRSGYGHSGTIRLRYRENPDSPGGEEQMDEEELDRIPQMRMFERRARELWDFFPVMISEGDGSDASLDGELEFYAERGRLYCLQQDMNGHEFRIEAMWRDGAWTVEETITPEEEYSGSKSALLVRDADTVAKSYTPGSLRLDKAPRVERVDINEDGWVVLHLQPGELMRCMVQTAHD